MDILSKPELIWFLVGLGLLLLELVLPGLVVIFFGIGAWITALACLIFPLEGQLAIQLLIFLVSSILGLVLLRKTLKKRFFDKKDQELVDQLEEFIGKKAKALEDFSDGTGKVEFKGTQWTARSEDRVSKGQWVIIKAKESLTLEVKAT